MKSSVIEILAEHLCGRHFTPVSPAPHRVTWKGGTVKGVFERSETDEGCWPVIVFEESDAGMSGEWELRDLGETFTLAEP